MSRREAMRSLRFFQRNFEKSFPASALLCQQLLLISLFIPSILIHQLELNNESGRGTFVRGRVGADRWRL